MWLTAPVEGDGCGDDGDPSQNGDDGQHHGVTTQAASSIDVALLQTVPGLFTHRVERNVYKGLLVYETVYQNRKWVYLDLFIWSNKGTLLYCYYSACQQHFSAADEDLKCNIMQITSIVSEP